MKTPSKILLDKLKQSQKDLPVIIGKEGVKFFQSNFDKQEFQDEPSLRWDKVKRKSGHKILQVTGRLKRNIRVISADSNRIVWGNDVPYAAFHNIFKNETVRVKSHTRTRQGNSYQVRAFKRIQKARPFMGKSKVFNIHNNKLIYKYLKSKNIL